MVLVQELYLSAVPVEQGLYLRFEGFDALALHLSLLLIPFADLSGSEVALEAVELALEPLSERLLSLHEVSLGVCLGLLDELAETGAFLGQRQRRVFQQLVHERDSALVSHVQSQLRLSWLLLLLLLLLLFLLLESVGVSRSVLGVVSVQETHCWSARERDR